MEGAPAPRSRPKGSWWKSLLVAWIGLRVVAAVGAAAGVRIPEEVGYSALAVVWALVWMLWRRSAEHDERRAHGLVRTARRLVVTFCVAVVMIGVVVLTLDSDAQLERTGVAAEAVASGVALIGLLSVVGGRIWVPRLEGGDRATVVRSFHRRLMARLAWAEVPALAAFGGFLLLGGEAWIYAIGLTASCAGLALATPTRASLEQDQERLDATGTETDLLESLDGDP